MIFAKCHFEELFKHILSEIEDDFDKDYDNDIAFTLEGHANEHIIEIMNRFERDIENELWDIESIGQSTDVAKRLIKENIVFLLYLYKKLEETE